MFLKLKWIFASMFYKWLNSLIIEKDFASKFDYKILVTNLTSERVTKVIYNIHMFLLSKEK